MHGISGSITSAIGDYGLYAVFLLMLIDAVFPAASELVMVYAGALAAGAFPGQTVTLFGTEIESTGWAYVAMAMAGTIGYTLGSVLGWAIGRYGGRPFLERHGRWLHVTPAKPRQGGGVVRSLRRRRGLLSRMLPSSVPSSPSPPVSIGMPLGRFTVLSFLGTIPWCFGLAGVGLALGSSWEEFHESFRYADYADRRPRGRQRRLRSSCAPRRNEPGKRALERSAEGVA